MADSELKTNSVKIRFDGSSREPTEPEIFDFMRGKLKLKADNLLSMYKDRLDAAVIIKFKNEEDFKATLARFPGTVEFAYNKYESTQVRLSPANAVVKYVRLFNLPPEVDDREIGAALAKYGRVQRLIREKYGEETGFPIWTSVRGVYLELKDGVEIPASIHVRNIRARVFYEGLVNKCFLCGAADHIKAECPERKTVNTRLDASRGSYSAALVGGAARWFKQKIADSTLNKEAENKMTNLNDLFPKTPFLKNNEEVKKVKEVPTGSKNGKEEKRKAPPAGSSSEKTNGAEMETDDLLSRAVKEPNSSQQQQTQKEKEKDGDGWFVVPTKNEKSKQKKIRSSSAGGSSESLDSMVLRSRGPRPSNSSDAQRDRARSRSAQKNGESKKPKITKMPSGGDKQTNDGEMQVDVVGENKVEGVEGELSSGGDLSGGENKGCGGDSFDDSFDDESL